MAQEAWGVEMGESHCRKDMKRMTVNKKKKCQLPEPNLFTTTAKETRDKPEQSL
jgi:hypothetical protein